MYDPTGERTALLLTPLVRLRNHLAMNSRDGVPEFAVSASDLARKDELGEIAREFDLELTPEQIADHLVLLAALSLGDPHGQLFGAADIDATRQVAAPVLVESWCQLHLGVAAYVARLVQILGTHIVHVVEYSCCAVPIPTTAMIWRSTSGRSAPK